MLMAKNIANLLQYIAFLMVNTQLFSLLLPQLAVFI
uniref:Uncharacterized protein n=1 Tax=Siphoviridae sp. ct2vX3 TaxID=2825318 RepID=A0A8S5PX75_9CAUD|nr:MAG TPA: hypothetical protein [Siphoviridae sp. ct2vX3]